MIELNNLFNQFVQKVDSFRNKASNWLNESLNHYFKRIIQKQHYTVFCLETHLATLLAEQK